MTAAQTMTTGEHRVSFIGSDDMTGDDGMSVVASFTAISLILMMNFIDPQSRHVSG